jgi:hypothetical protein
MPRKAFYSFHYEPDNWRASQIRNAGIIEGNQAATDNDWESIKRGGDIAIQRWIDNQLDGKSVAIVLIGANTMGRRWINYEISKAWNDGKGLLGIHIHYLKDRYGFQSSRGANPFSGFTLNSGAYLSNIVQVYDPPFWDSQLVYNHIRMNMANWIEQAIEIRNRY